MGMDSRLENRLKHACTLWIRYLESAAIRQLDRWLSESLRAEKRFGRQDRRFYSDTLFAAVRYVTLALFLDDISQELASFLQRSESEKEKAVRVFSQGIATEELLWEKIRKSSPEKVIRFAHQSSMDAPLFLSERQQWIEALRLKTDWTDFDYQLLLILNGIPPAWFRALKRRKDQSQWTSEQVILFLQMQNERPPLWIRLNQTAAREKVAQDFQSHDLQLEWSSTDENCARVTGVFGVYQTETFKTGLFEVQDWASQQIAAALGVRTGQKIWDACAGGGGKSVAIAAALRGKGALYASDIREHKLVEARRRCQRAGFHNVRTFAWDGQTTPSFGKEILLQGGFDSVLVDAPCSSSGTWRRNPDARLRIRDDESRHSLYQLQKDLLARAAAQVRPGGRLVYGTCSWCVEENEDVVNTVTSNRPEAPVSVQLLGCPFQDSDTMFACSIVLSSSQSS